MFSCAALACCVMPACRSAAPPPPLVAQVSGTIAIAGLSAPVRVARDRWGVPHIYARSRDDLFTAQGFVQAQDRLFQMDLWKRWAHGRLAEVLGANFIDRDAMTRRAQYHGDPNAEWAAYAPDARAVASAFVRGVNAWVVLARERPPEEFVLAGWRPGFWSPADLLARTDAFAASADALVDVFIARLIAAAGERRAAAILAVDPARLPRGLDPSMDHYVIDEAIRRIGAPPFFVGLPPPQDAARLPHPATQYLVHLHAPGWNVIGATPPWMPGVAVGHDETVVWERRPADADTQDVLVEAVDPANTRIVRDAIVVKGRTAPVVFDIEITPRGVVIASDRERNRVFTLRWSGSRPGASPLAALATRSDPDPRRGSPHPPGPAFDPVLAWLLRSHPDRAEAILRDPDDARATLERAAADMRRRRPALFSHVLAVTAERHGRFNIGPFQPAEDRAPFQIAFDRSDWDRSTAINAPGQSESPASRHFADLAALWAEGRSIPLWFSDAAVRANTAATLTLEPAQKP